MSISLDKSKLNIIVAYTHKNRYISDNGNLPWKGSLKGDFAFLNKFIRLEPNTAIIMGRKTYEKIPKYKGIEIIVLSKDKNYQCNFGMLFSDFEDALNYCKSKNLNIIIFGGQEIYKVALKYPCKLYCTIVQEKDLSGDVKFPENNIELENITAEVHKFLLNKDVNPTWILKNNAFEENEYVYNFFTGNN